MRKQILSGLVILFFCLGLTKTYAQKWQSGYYYDNDGKKVTGFISGEMRNTNISPPENDYFLFSKVDDTSYSENKGVKIFAKQVISFVIATDTFVVSYSNILKKPFLDVLTNTKVKVYATEILRNNPFGGGTWFILLAATNKLKYVDITYYYGPDPDNLTILNKNNFTKEMAVILADRPDVYKLIQDKTFTYDNIDKLLTFLNTGQVSTDDDTDTQ